MTRSGLQLPPVPGLPFQFVRNYQDVIPSGDRVLLDRSLSPEENRPGQPLWQSRERCSLVMLLAGCEPRLALQVIRKVFGERLAGQPFEE